MSWIFVKTVMLKLWTWLKHNIPFMLLLILFIFMFITYRSKIASLKDVIKLNRESYKKEIAAINENYEQEKKAKEDLKNKKEKDLDNLNKEKEEKEKELKEKHDKEVKNTEKEKKKYVNTLKDNKDEVGSEIDSYVNGDLND